MQDIGAEELTGRTAKIDIAQLVTRQTIPATMIPRTSHEIIQVVLVCLFQNLIGHHGAIKIFLIPPTRDVHDWYSDVFELRDQGSLLPEVVVIRMRNEVIPGGYLAVKV